MAKSASQRYPLGGHRPQASARVHRAAEYSCRILARYLMKMFAIVWACDPGSLAADDRLAVEPFAKLRIGCERGEGSCRDGTIRPVSRAG
jgi:hypothetical protein